MKIRQETTLDWVFLVFIIITLPVILLLGFRAYLGVLEQITGNRRIVKEGLVQELEHRIRSEQGRKCILDAIDALSKDELIQMPLECESPDLTDLMEELERAEERLLN